MKDSTQQFTKVVNLEEEEELKVPSPTIFTPIHSPIRRTLEIDPTQ